MEKKKYLPYTARALAFLLILALLLTLASAVFRPKDNRKSAGMNFVSAHGFLGEPDHSLDVLFLGDSMTYSAYTPLEMWDEQGFTSYVSAIGSGRMNTAYDFLTKALKTQHPKVVVLEAHVAIRYTPFNDSVVTEIARLFSIFEDHDHWKTLSPQDLYTPPNYTYLDDNKGFRPNKSVAAADAKDYMKQTNKKSSINVVTQFYLDRLIRLCQRENIQLLLVGTPSTKNWDTKQHNATQAVADQYGVDFLDLSLLTDEVGIDWETDSRDKGDHLNFYGAQKVSAYISAYLSEHYQLPDHREDPSYASWDEALAIYREQMT